MVNLTQSFKMQRPDIYITINVHLSVLNAELKLCRTLIRECKATRHTLELEIEEARSADDRGLLTEKQYDLTRATIRIEDLRRRMAGLMGAIDEEEDYLFEIAELMHNTEFGNDEQPE